MYFYCCRCGKKWNVSVKTETNPDKYVCPYCFYNEKKEALSREEKKDHKPERRVYRPKR